MSDHIIRVSTLGKQYLLGSKHASNGRFAEVMLEALLAPVRRIFVPKKNQEKDLNFWALKGLSFDISDGEIVGIIGRNGAGKSTLLKILSRITEPTEGAVELFGRVGSILEVGVGFHGELSGRENIYLNGAVLGMKQREISKKFSDIVEFAGIEQFLDTPIKRYSSGMYVRLAFAVAAFLEPEILIVDEVLAVGDMEFQKRCLGKMSDVARDGRTVLFVSHNMAAARHLCERAIVLSHGQLVADTTIEDAINLYIASCTTTELGVKQWGDPPATAKLWPASLQLLGESEQLQTSFGSHQSITLELWLEVFQTTTCQVMFIIINSQHVRVFSTEATPLPTVYEAGKKYRMRVTLPGSLLAPDLYRVALRIHNGTRNTFFQDDHALSPVIEDTSSSTMRLLGQRPGIIYVNLPWEISNGSSS